MQSKILTAVAIIAAVAAVLSLGLNAERVSDVAIIRLRVDDLERRIADVERGRHISGEAQLRSDLAKLATEHPRTFAAQADH